MIPAYKKESKKRRGKKPGRKDGHEGSWREKLSATNFKTHELMCCPDCGSSLCKIGKRKRIIEDIPITRLEVTEHTIIRYFCKSCNKRVEPALPEALDSSRLGVHFLLTTAWLHYGLGMTIGNIVKWLNVIIA